MKLLEVRHHGADLERELLHGGAAVDAEQREHQLEVTDTLNLDA